MPSVWLLVKCHNCGHSVGQYSGGYVWGRPFCGTHLPAEMATWHHLNLERKRPLPYQAVWYHSPATLPGGKDG